MILKIKQLNLPAGKTTKPSLILTFSLFEFQTAQFGSDSPPTPSFIHSTELPLLSQLKKIKTQSIQPH